MGVFRNVRPRKGKLKFEGNLNPLTWSEKTNTRCFIHFVCLLTWLGSCVVLEVGYQRLPHYKKEPSGEQGREKQKWSKGKGSRVREAGAEFS